MNRKLQGELWEIQGLLYFLVFTQLQQWTRWIFLAQGIIAIVGGFYRQYKEWKKESTPPQLGE
jgi:hypothetical protein